MTPLLFPLASVEPGADPADLAPLRELVGDARIVALGECTHGTREVFALKERLVEHLVTELGFDAFGIEASMPDTLPLGAYVGGGDGDGDPAALVKGMGFWTWSTPEVRDLAERLRAVNQDHPDAPVHWVGFDMQAPGSAAAALAARLRDHDPQSADELAQIADSLDPRAFASAAVSVDVPGAHQISVSGWIRTEDVSHWAGLWIRADGADQTGLAFDNMMRGGPTGTSGWHRYTTTVEAPAATIRASVGVILSGSGSAWFDALEVRVDGRPWTPAAEVDLDFERAIPIPVEGPTTPVLATGTGWTAGGAGYAWASDPAAHDGSAALRVFSPAADADRIARVAAALAERAFPDLDGEPLAELRLLARVLAQGVAHRRAPELRDRAMAENVGAWLDALGPDARIVLWAHNGHVARQDGRMGQYLADRYGADYLPLGFACGDGTYRAHARDGSGLAVLPLTPAPRGAIERRLAGGPPIALVDLRAADAPSWLDRPSSMRSIGAREAQDQFERAVLPDLYDLVLYVAHTTAADQLRP